MKIELRTAVILQLTKDRKGEVIVRETLKKALQCYVDMGLVTPKPMKSGDTFLWQGDKNLTTYDEEFEAPFLQNTKQHFDQQATVWNSNLNCPEYLQEVEKALAKEEENADFWLQPETKPKMLKIVENEMITKKAESAVEKDTGCVYMFQHSRL